MMDKVTTDENHDLVNSINREIAEQNFGVALRSFVATLVAGVVMILISPVIFMVALIKAFAIPVIVVSVYY